MFAQNERISTRQFKRLLTLELFGVTTALLPGILCKTVQRDGVTALAGGVLLVFLYGLLLKAAAKRAGRSLQQTLKEKKKVVYEIFLLVMTIQMILMGIWVLTLAAELSRDILLQEMDLRVVICTFAFVCVAGALQGMECRGRMAEILYAFLLLPFLFFLFLAARKMNLDTMQPILTEPAKTIGKGSYEVFIVFQGVTLGFFALPYLKDQKDFWKGVKKSIWLNGLFCLLLLVVAIGIFGIDGAANQNWLAVNLMTTPDFPGGLVERMDVLMVTIWIVALFFFVSGSIFYGGKMVGRLFSMKRERTGLWILSALIVAGSILMGNKDYAYYVYMTYMKYIGVPLLLLLLFFICAGLRPKKAVAGAMCVFLALSFTGCAKGVELEDREFVLALGVEIQEDKVLFYYDTSNTQDGSGEASQEVVRIEADAFYELTSAYGQQSDKYLDYNHLKALVIGKNLASDADKLSELLQFIEQNELFARNTKLFFSEDAERIFSLCTSMNTALGEYLENLYVDSDYYVEGQSASLGDLIKHRHEKEETFLVPVLKAGEKQPLIDSYGIVRDVQWIEKLRPQEAELVFLGNGVNIKETVKVDRTYAVKINNVRKEVAFSDDKSINAVVTLEIRGQLKNKEAGKQKREIETEMEKQLEENYGQFLIDYKALDLFHLFRSLGSHNRQMWQQYHEKRAEFINQCQVTFKIKASIE